MAAWAIPVSAVSPGQVVGSARGLECGRVVDCARTAAPVEPGCARGGSWGMCYFFGAVGACTVGGGWDDYVNPTLREARGFSFRRDFAGPAWALGYSTAPLRLRGIVEEYSQT